LYDRSESSNLFKRKKKLSIMEAIQYRTKLSSTIRPVSKMRVEKENSNETDLLLLAKILQGNEHALALLYDKYGRLIYSLTLRIVQKEEEARELVQDVFLQVWHKAALFDNERGSFATWLVTLAHNKSINTLRSRRYKKIGLEAKFDLSTITSDLIVNHRTPERDALESDERRIVLNALEQIPALQQKALYMAYYEGYSHSEIARMLDEPLGTIKTRIRKGMMKLALILAR
jgi:RNA polymerase sigma-70 factor (ECF subfamily)